MKEQKQRKINKQSGAAMLITVLFFVFISLAIISGLVAPSIREFKIATDSLHSRQSFFLSESGVEDLFYRMKTGLAYPVDSPTILELNGGTASSTVSGAYSAIGEGTITSIGDVSSKQRKSELVIFAGTGIAFSYGVESGQGGFVMGNGSQVIGSVYSNGQITGSGSIRGSASSANASALFTDQINDTGTPIDVSFGNTNSTQDFAQSFKVTTSDTINKIDLYLKKVGTPANLTVRIVEDNGGVPSTIQITSGSLSSSLVSTNYGWISVPFSTNPMLTANTTYWFIIDGGTNASRYYKIGTNNDGYVNGIDKIGQYGGSWGNTSPSTLDGFFKIYLGGGPMGLISGVTVGSSGVGNAYANTINSANVAGTKYCKSTNNFPACNTSLPDPTQVAMPISDQNIQDWKNDALAGGTHSGNLNISGATSYGPKKITGNLTVSNGGDLTLTGTLWVQGNLDIGNHGTIRLSPSYGSSEGLIIVDGIVIIGNNANFYGSGTTGSYPTVLSTSSSTSAITLSNNAGAVVLYAANGTITVANNAGATSINGYRINLQNNAIINYDSGLINANFISGPTGGWSIKNWKEIE